MALHDRLQQRIKKNSNQKYGIDLEVSLSEILGGADTRIFKVEMTQSNSNDVPSVAALRLFRGNAADRAKREFDVLKLLSKTELRVPEVYFYDITVPDESYYVMEWIDGKSFNNVAVSDPSRIDQYMHKFYSQMSNLHNVNFQKLIPEMNIEASEVYVKRYIQHCDRIVQKFNLNDFKEAIDSLYDKVDSLSLGEPVLLHGDFHGFNVMVDRDDNLVVIDWANIGFGDFRLDLSFSITAFNSAMGDQTSYLTSLYSQVSGREVCNIEFFMLISNFHNLLRMYSCATDYRITGENDSTKNLFLGEFRSYTEYLVDLFENELPIKLEIIRNKL